MAIGPLNHVTIRAVDLEATRRFYADALGLEPGDRPPLSFPGYWLYSDGQPTVHLIGPKAEEGGAARHAGPTGLFDHVAFSATGLAAQRERLRRLGIAFEERVVPRNRQTQIFLHDPNGIAVELNFPPEETTAA